MARRREGRQHDLAGELNPPVAHRLKRGWQHYCPCIGVHRGALAELRVAISLQNGSGKPETA
jgi:hypothetical protein